MVPRNGFSLPALPRLQLFTCLLMPEKIEFPQIDATLVQRAAEVVKLAKAGGCTIITAESCTGGLLAAVLAEAPGAATQLQGGFVTYTKD